MKAAYVGSDMKYRINLEGVQRDLFLVAAGVATQFAVALQRRL